MTEANGLDSLQWYDFFRMLIMSMALVTMYISGKRAIRLFSQYPDLLKQLWWLFNFSMFVALEGTLEQILFDAGYGPRTFLLFLYVLAALRLTARRDKDFTVQFHLKRKE